MVVKERPTILRKGGRTMKVIMLDVDGVLNSYNTRQTIFGFTFVDDK